MPRRVSATEARTKPFAILDDVEKGEEFEITRRGRVVARIAPARRPHRFMGMHSGLARSVARDEDLYSTGETWNAM